MALLGFTNGFWMLAAPIYWYRYLPADIPALGSYNQHFIQDVGCAYLAVSLALAWGARRPALRQPMVVVAATFYAAHALIHVWGTERGVIPASHWLMELPSVYLPTLLLVAVAAMEPGWPPE